MAFSLVPFRPLFIKNGGILFEVIPKKNFPEVRFFFVGSFSWVLLSLVVYKKFLFT